jgi:hypothetical protein
MKALFVSIAERIVCAFSNTLKGFLFSLIVACVLGLIDWLEGVVFGDPYSTPMQILLVIRLVGSFIATMMLALPLALWTFILRLIFYRHKFTFLISFLLELVVAVPIATFGLYIGYSLAMEPIFPASLANKILIYLMILVWLGGVSISFALGLSKRGEFRNHC